ncbi:hypothetical protein GCM10009796_05800 [Microbacterium koreense]
MFVPLAAFTLVLTGCAAPDAETDGAPSASPGQTVLTEEAVVPLDLAGTWTQSNSQSPTAYQVATITADTITIDWVNEDEDMTAVYWIGTYVPPAEDVDTYAWESVGDTEAMATQLLASGSETKTFTFTADVLIYELQALGETMEVTMTRD